jgi:hypothetical protein
MPAANSVLVSPNQTRQKVTRAEWKRRRCMIWRAYARPGQRTTSTLWTFVGDFRLLVGKRATRLPVSHRHRSQTTQMWSRTHCACPAGDAERCSR